MKKNIFIFICLFGIIVFCAYANSLQQNLSDNLIRLHIIAEGNSSLDQEIKLKVRDRIICAAQDKFSMAADKDTFRCELLGSLGEIKAIADNVLTEYGVPYRAEVSIEKTYIPRKIYDGVILPEGRYEGLIVRLGAAEGENWWCVVYPPLCFTESTCGELSEEGKLLLRDKLSPDAYSLITSEGIDIEYKFKAIELLQRLKKSFE